MHAVLSSIPLCIRKIQLPGVGMLLYTLTETELPGGYNQYGITVALQSTVKYMEKSVGDVTTNRELALRIFWQLCRGTVTPSTLTEILPELLG